MQILFRTDASLDIGTGHVMRCLTLAHALRERGAACRFVCREHRGHLADVIRGRGFQVDLLAHGAPLQGGHPTPPHGGWLGTDPATDARQTLAVLDGEMVDLLVVDHYALDAAWERALRHACRRLAVIDDLADRPHDCDLLLDQNLGRAAADYANLVPGGCKVLAGAEHALLRPEFAALRGDSLARRQSGALRRILVAMGGVDKDNVTEQVFSALKSCKLGPEAAITVVLGPSAPWLAQVRAVAATMPWPTAVEVNAPHMARLMADSDLAIGAAGTTAWERCCLGLPSLIMVLADNQRRGAAALAAANAALLLKGGDNFPLELAETLAQLGDRQALLAMQSACAAITGGQGARQLAAELIDGLA